MARVIDWGPLLTGMSDEARVAALEALRKIVTEENTDSLIYMFSDKLPLPFWLRWLPVATVLDKLLPERLLQVFEKILIRKIP